MATLKTLREVFANERVRIERHQRAGCVAIDRHQIRGFQTLQSQVPLRLAKTMQRLGQNMAWVLKKLRG